MLGHAIDITERVAVERTLRESEQALRAAQADLEAKSSRAHARTEEANARLRVEMAERERRTPSASCARRSGPGKPAER